MRSIRTVSHLKCISENSSSLLALWQTWEALIEIKSFELDWIEKQTHIFILLFNTFQCQWKWKCCDGFTFFTASTINERVKVFSGMSCAVAAAAAILLFVDFFLLSSSFSLARSLTQKRHFYHHHHTQQFQFELLFSAALFLMYTNNSTRYCYVPFYPYCSYQQFSTLALIHLYSAISWLSS